MDTNENDTYSQIRSDFIRDYGRKAVPFFEIFEKKQKKIIIRHFIQSLLLASVISFLMVLAHGIVSYQPDWNECFMDFTDFLYNNYCGIFIWLSAMFFFALYFPFTLISLERNKIQLKKAVMPYICECFGYINLKWHSGKYMTPLERTNAEMLYRRARLDFLNDSKSGPFCSNTLTVQEEIKSCFALSFYSCGIFYDDIFNGRYNGIKFDIYETTVRRPGDRSVVVTFKGVILRLDMNKKFKGTTVIAPRGSKISGLKRTVLEDTDFEKMFDVYTSDEVEVRYLITTAFMQRFKHLGSVFDAHKQRCSFYQESLIIALETGRDLFSPGSLFARADYYTQCIRLIDEISSLIKLIDYLKLDTKIEL